MLTCICGERAHGRVKTVRSRGGTLRIACCRRCGLARDLTVYDRDAFYRAKGGYELPTEETFELSVAAMERYARVVSSVVPTAGKALDVGCNAGYLLKALEARGWKAWGVDVNPDYAEYGAKKGLKIRAGDAAKTEFSEAPFDLVALAHTLEHMTDPAGALRRAAELTKEGGFLFVAVPNYRAPFQKATLFIPGQHVWYFTERTLRRTVEAFGFEAVRSTTLEGMTADTRLRVPFARAFKAVVIRLTPALGLGEEIVAVFRKRPKTE